VGEKAPTFSVASVNTDGKVTIQPGKVTVVEFWATWNGPAKVSFPKLEALRKTYEPRGLAIVAVSVDDEPEGCLELSGSGRECVRRGNILTQFATEMGARFPIAWDRDHLIAQRWHVRSMPSVYVVDRSGFVRHVNEGWHDGDEKELEREILPLL
jgi:thiol-disulfide isomerase/thioredoxin